MIGVSATASARRTVLTALSVLLTAALLIAATAQAAAAMPESHGPADTAGAPGVARLALAGLQMESHRPATTAGAPGVARLALAGLQMESHRSATTAGAAAADAAPQRSTLRPGESLSPGQSIRSPDGQYRLVLQHDGNLVLHETDGLEVLWNARTAGESDRTLVMQHDGNLVLYEHPITVFQALWHSRTHGSPGASLAVRDDGTATIGYNSGRVLWTAGGTPDVGLSGTKHVIYERGAQQVSLVEADGSILDSYPVTGRATTPTPGRYAVFSKSPKAWSFTPGITMRHMVRFTHGPNGKNIGFHAIPTNRRGVPIQSEDELGQFGSGGCIRQRNDKAEQLYRWAPLGTPVIVVA